MTQEFKNIYFSDFPADSPKKRNVTLAFGSKHLDLYKAIKPVSSYEFREILGHSSYISLQKAAERASLTINAYCLRQLRKRLIASASVDDQYDLPLASDQGARPLIEPIQATFKGGHKEPLHNWYPYLEGYSPRFVEQLLEEFAPEAGVVLDPFAGTGTTPLTVAKVGRRAFYCELNPLLQYLTDVKIMASRLDVKSRRRIQQQLREVAGSFQELLKQTSPDIELQIAYSRTFERSRFFDAVAYDEVLRARATIDKLACTEPLVARFLTIAVLSSLVEVSRLIRRGDLRFKTAKEVNRGQLGLSEAVRARLKKMTDDLDSVTSLAERPTLVCEDARRLAHIPVLEVEAIITSPPYLNGTNYFRNTKLELWFLRCLRTSRDLSEFRRKTVTAGINDVTSSKDVGEVTGELAVLISRLTASAYDKRIPKMVASYFLDIGNVFRAAAKHLKPNAKILIDIGDSVYGGVHVPTNSILISTLTAEGYEFEREITLRRRTSRGRMPLKQVLLSFRYPGRGPRASANIRPSWHRSWENFKRDLPHQKGEFAKRNWGHPLHSLCSYQGKMKPSLAANLVKTFVPEGGSMLDPFGGVGTIPFEAALRGVTAYTFEISPTALHIARAKLAQPVASECEFILKSLERFILEHKVKENELESARAIRFNGSLVDYFEARTFQEVLLARRFLKHNPPQSPSASLVLSSLLHILHGNRPYALSRRSHPITPFAPSGPYEYRPLGMRLREKVRRSLAVEYPKDFVAGVALHQDATGWWPQEINELDAIITSPPFFNSTRFFLANWMRLWFCGWEAGDFKTQPLSFIDERQKSGFEIYEPVFRQARERLRNKGVLILHLGKSRKCDMAEALTQVAVRWFRVADLFTESVDHCESHGIRDKGTVTAHQFLVLQ